MKVQLIELIPRELIWGSFLAENTSFFIHLTSNYEDLRNILCKTLTDNSWNNFNEIFSNL